LKRALAIADKALGPDHPNVGTMLNNLAELYRAQGRLAEAEPLYKRALAITEKALGPDHPDTGASLNNLALLYRAQGRLAEAEPLFERVRAMPQGGARQFPILFATNRAPEAGAKTPGFGAARDERLNFGAATMLAVGDIVKARGERRASGGGMLDKSGAALTASGSIAIRRIDPAPDMEGAAKALPAPKQALIFVHGFNTGFEDALKRTAQVAFDLDFPGQPMLFSWPSKSRFWGYLADRDSADIAADYLVEFLDAAGKTMPETKLNIVAHSMGNLVLLSALEKIALRGAEKRPRIGEIILAHPDVDGGRFRQLAKRLQGEGYGLTLYTSRDDKAMWLSGWLSGDARAGGAAAAADGVDTIDITGLSTSFWSANHNTFSGNPIVFGDMARLIASGERPPHKRTQSFEEVPGEKGSYWRYRITVSEGGFVQ